MEFSEETDSIIVVQHTHNMLIKAELISLAAKEMLKTMAREW